MKRSRLQSTIVQNSKGYFDIITYCEDESLGWVETREAATNLMRKEDAKKIYRETVEKAVGRKGAKLIYSGEPIRG